MRELTQKERDAETDAIIAIRARLKKAMYQLEAPRIKATPLETETLKRLQTTRDHTRASLLRTGWAQTYPPPRNFKISKIKPWMNGEITLPRNHVSWYFEALRHSPEK